MVIGARRNPRGHVRPEEVLLGSSCLRSRTPQECTRCFCCCHSGELSAARDGTWCSSHTHGAPHIHLELLMHTCSSSHTPGGPQTHLEPLTHTWSSSCTPETPHTHQNSSRTPGAPHTHLEFLTHTWSSSHPSGTVPRQVFAMDGHKPEALRSTSATHGHVSTAGEISQLKE